MSLGGQRQRNHTYCQRVFFLVCTIHKEADILDLFNYECDSAAYFGQYNTCKCPYWREI